MQYGITSTFENLVGFWKFRTNSTNGLFSNSVQDLSVNNNSLRCLGSAFQTGNTLLLHPSRNGALSSVVQVNVTSYDTEMLFTRCVSCDAGQYQNEVSHQRSSCKLCKLGKYQNGHNGSVACKLCPISRYADEEGTRCVQIMSRRNGNNCIAGVSSD